MQNTAFLSLSIGPGSLLLLPANVPTSAFGGYTNAGLIHNVGTVLTITATQGFTGIGSVGDHVNCSGTILAAAGGSINLNGGLTISGSGNVNLGNGSLTVNDASSGITSAAGWLSAYNAYVGSSGTGTFSQSGGTNSLGNVSLGGSGGLYLGNNASDSGTYNLSGSGLLSTYFAYVGNSGNGTFIQSGGTNTIGNFGASPAASGGLYLGYNGGSNGSYTLSGSAALSAYYEYVGTPAAALSTSRAGRTISSRTRRATAASFPSATRQVPAAIPSAARGSFRHSR